MAWDTDDTTVEDLDVDVVEDEVKDIDEIFFEDGSEDGKVEVANDVDDDDFA